jgi:hypothetical protein
MIAVPDGSCLTRKVKTQKANGKSANNNDNFSALHGSQYPLFFQLPVKTAPVARVAGNSDLINDQ